MVMLFPAMKQGESAYAKGKEYHEIFKKKIVNNFKAKHRQAGNKQGQDGTMYGTCNGSRNAKRIPVNLQIHSFLI